LRTTPAAAACAGPIRATGKSNATRTVIVFHQSIKILQDKADRHARENLRRLYETCSGQKEGYLEDLVSLPVLREVAQVLDADFERTCDYTYRDPLA
jgi:hypothetical protein